MRLRLSVFILTLSLALSGAAGTAAAQSYECDLSGNSTATMAACNAGNANPAGTNVAVKAVTTGGATCTTDGTFCGVRSDAATAAALPLSVYGSCDWIDNTSNNSIFVPFKSSGEWTAFTGNRPSGINLVPCTLPGSGATASVTPPYPGSSTQSVSVPNLYGRADSTMSVPASNSSSIWPTTAAPTSLTWTSYNGATAITGLQQWHGGSASTPNWVPTFIFSANLTLTAQDTTTGGSAATTITATTGDTIKLVYSGSDTYGTINSAVTGGSPNSWNISSGTTSGSSIAGSGTVVLSGTAGTYTYTLTTTDSNNLTSTAKVTITALAPAQCGSDNGGLFSSLSTLPGGTGLCASPDTASPGSPAVVNVAGINGWSWQCKTADGNTSSCNAIQTAPQCGSVTIDPSSNISGTLCLVGSPTTTPTYGNQTYACTASYGSATATTGTCSTVAYTPPTCPTPSVANGTVGAYPRCAITCNSGYSLSGNTCVQDTCSITSVDKGTVGAYPGCAITCNSGYSLSGNSCVLTPVNGTCPADMGTGFDPTLFPAIVIPGFYIPSGEVYHQLVTVIGGPTDFDHGYPAQWYTDQDKCGSGTLGGTGAYTTGEGVSAVWSCNGSNGGTNALCAIGTGCGFYNDPGCQ